MSLHVPKTSDELHTFLFCVHDWLAHHTGDTYWWNQYDVSLKDIIDEKTSSMTASTKHWINQTFDQPLTIKTLLYKYQVFAVIIDEEIFTDLNYTPLYALIAIMISRDMVFAPPGSMTLWQDMEHQPDVINVLRRRRSAIKQFSHHMACQDDITPDQLIHDHGKVASLGLLYGLYLTCVILIHEQRVRSDPDLQAIVDTLFHTLTSLKGVFDHVESQ